MLGLRDDKMRERLLRINDLTLEKAIDICKASEQTSAQLQAMQSGNHDVVSFVRKRQTRHAASTPANRTYKPGLLQSRDPEKLFYWRSDEVI